MRVWVWRRKLKVMYPSNISLRLSHSLFSLVSRLHLLSHLSTFLCVSWLQKTPPFLLSSLSYIPSKPAPFNSQEMLQKVKEKERENVRDKDRAWKWEWEREKEREETREGPFLLLMKKIGAFWSLSFQSHVTVTKSWQIK